MVWCAALVVETSIFFFSQPAAGLTNWVPVWDYWASTPLSTTCFFHIQDPEDEREYVSLDISGLKFLKYPVLIM